MRYPTRFQQKTLWNAATGLAILIIGSLLVGLIWLIGQVFGFGLQPLLPLHRRIRVPKWAFDEYPGANSEH